MVDEQHWRLASWAFWALRAGKLRAYREKLKEMAAATEGRLERDACWRGAFELEDRAEDFREKAHRARQAAE